MDTVDSLDFSSITCSSSSSYSSVHLLLWHIRRAFHRVLPCGSTLFHYSFFCTDLSWMLLSTITVSSISLWVFLYRQVYLSFTFLKFNVCRIYSTEWLINVKIAFKKQSSLCSLTNSVFLPIILILGNDSIIQQNTRKLWNHSRFFY